MVNYFGRNYHALLGLLIFILLYLLLFNLIMGHIVRHRFIFVFYFNFVLFSIRFAINFAQKRIRQSKGEPYERSDRIFANSNLTFGVFVSL